MADPWPISLPQAPLVGAGRAPIDGTLRARPDTGPPITRRRYTAVPIILDNWETVLTGTQYVTLMAFHDTTLVGGSLPFDWDDPLDGTTVEMRFLEPPRAICIRPDSNTANRLWRVNLSLAIDP